MKNKLRLGLQNGELVAVRKIDEKILIDEFGENYGETRDESDGDGGCFTFRYFPLSDLQEITNVFKIIEIESC